MRDDAIVASMRTQYGIDAQYAAELRDGLVTRAAGASGASGSSAPKRLYSRPPGARELLTGRSLPRATATVPEGCRLWPPA